MKRSVVRFLFPLLFFSSAASAQERNIDSFVRRLFTVIRTNDEAGFIKAFPDRRQVLRYFRSIVPPEKEAMMDSGLLLNPLFASDSAYDEGLRPELTKDFRKLQEQIATYHIAPSALSLRTYTIDSSLSRERIKTAEASLLITAGGKEYALSFREISWSPADRFWFGVTLGRFRPKGEPEVIEEVEDSFETDTSSRSPAGDTPPSDVSLHKPRPTVKKTVEKAPPARNPKHKS